MNSLGAVEKMIRWKVVRRLSEWTQPWECRVVAEAALLLRPPEHKWEADLLRPLVLSASPASLLHITRRLSPPKALRFVLFLQSLSPPLPSLSLSASFQALFEHTSRSKDCAHPLVLLWKQSLELHVPLTSSSAILLLRCFGRAGMLPHSLSLFHSLPPSLRTPPVCNHLIHSSLRWGRPHDALKVLDDMLLNFPPNQATANLVFPALFRRLPSGMLISDKKIAGLVLKFLAHCVFPDALFFTELISRLCKGGMTDLAWDVLHDAAKFGCPLETPSCNALLTGLGRDRDFQRMNTFMEEMKELNVQPNVVTFGILINFMCKSQMVDGALQLFEKMSRGEDGISIQPDVIMYNSLIDGLCKAGRQEEGLELVKQMRLRCGCAPNHVTYNSLVNGFCSAGEIERARGLVDEMESEGLQPDVVTLNTLVNGMCRSGRTNSALAFVSEMQHKGLKGDVRTYTTLIKAYCNVNNIDKAKKLFDQMESEGHSPDAILYYTLISGLSQARRMHDASRMACKMKEAGFRLDIVCFNMLISGFCKMKMWDNAHELLKEMEKAEVKPDSVTYNILISYFSKTGNWTKTQALLKQMMSSGFQLDVVTYGLLIHAHCLHGMFDEAVQILKKMSCTSGVTPNTVIYNILIDSLCKNDKVELALSLMDDMKVKGVRPNTTTYNAMLKGLREKNSLQKAFELMDRMVEQGCDPDYITMEILIEWLPAIGEMQKLKYFVSGGDAASVLAV